MPDLTAEAPFIAWNQIGSCDVRNQPSMTTRKYGDETYVVDKDKHRRRHVRSVKSSRPDGPLFEDVRRHGRLVLLPDLHACKRDDEHAKQHEKRDDPPVMPRVLGPAPLQREKDADDGRQKQGCPEDVELLQPVFPADSFACAVLVRVGEKENKYCGDKTEGEIDIEAGASTGLASVS